MRVFSLSPFLRLAYGHSGNPDSQARELNGSSAVVYLDNIEVDSNGRPDVRPTATINGNSRRESADTTPTAEQLEHEPGFPLGNLLQ